MCEKMSGSLIFLTLSTYSIFPMLSLYFAVGISTELAAANSDSQTLTFSNTEPALPSNRRRLQDELMRLQNCGQIRPVPGEETRTQSPWVAGIFTRRDLSSKEPQTPAQTNLRHRRLKYLVTGTILSSTLVLTIFGGAFASPPRGFKGEYLLFPAEKLVVAAGLKSNNLTVGFDEHSQFAEVEYIVPYHNPAGTGGNKHFHLILLHLKTPLDLTSSFVRAICIHLDPVAYHEILPLSGEGIRFRSLNFSVSPFNLKGYASGFASSSGKLVVVNGTTGSRRECHNSFRYYYKSDDDSHVFCAKYELEGKVPEGMCWTHGSPMVIWIPMLRRWMLTGITALIPHKRQGKCKWHFNANFVYNVETEWILRHLYCSPKGFPCSERICIDSKFVCDGKRDCRNGDDEEPLYCEQAVNKCRLPSKASTGKTHSCGLTDNCIRPDQLCNGKTDCMNKSDEESRRCAPTTTVSPANSSLGLMAVGATNKEVTPDPESMQMRMMPRVTSQNHQRMSGEKSLNAVTTAQKTKKICPAIQISEGVTVSCSGPEVGMKSTDCSHATTGVIIRLSCKKFYIPISRFSSITMNCTEEGIWSPYRAFACEAECGVLRSRHDKNNQLFPWHASIFRMSPSTRKFELVCGGTLLENTVVVSAAHCITKSGMMPNLSDFRIVLAPISTEFADHEQDDGISQILRIRTAWIPPTYDALNLKGDIIMIRMDKAVIYGEYTRPICYMKQRFKTLPGTDEVGMITGFRHGKSGAATSVTSNPFFYREFSMASDEECQGYFEWEKPKHVFCGRAISGKTLCEKDSGSGLVVQIPGTFTESRQKHLLMGIATFRQTGGTNGILAKDSCSTGDISIFTAFDDFTDWIYTTLEDMEF